jgi:hypothetical protein
MGDLVLGPFLAAAALLLVAGVPKLADPLPLVRSLRAAGVPAGRVLVRAFAAAEVAVGAAALAAPNRVTALLVAGAYVVFTAFVARVLTRGGVLGSCGCFGKPDTPATRTHLALTALAATTALAAAVDPPSPLWSHVDGAGLGAAGMATVIAFLAWQAMAVLPTVSPAAIRSTGKG